MARNIMRGKYKVIRYYFNEEHEAALVAVGLTKEEAMAHCNDPETSSSTAKGPAAQAHTDRMGPWFDGWTDM